MFDGITGSEATDLGDGESDGRLRGGVMHWREGGVDVPSAILVFVAAAVSRRMGGLSRCVLPEKGEYRVFPREPSHVWDQSGKDGQDRGPGAS